MLVKLGEMMNDIHQDEVEQRNVTAQKKHGDNDHERGISQLLVTADPLVPGFPRPRSFPQLGSDFPEKIFRLCDHGNVSKKPGQEGLEPPTDGFGDRYSTN
jgi:hypothetical protein